MRSCGYCGRSIVSRNAQARFCSDHCRNYWRRERMSSSLLAGMLDRDRWIRRDAKKMPLTVNGRAASSTDSQTWSTHAAARKSSVGIGLGYVLGDGIGCLDLDHCLVDGKPTAAAAALLANYVGHFIEVSPSGDGLHIWGLANEAPGTKRTVDGVALERYSVGRYITITGNVYQHGELLPL